MGAADCLIADFSTALRAGVQSHDPEFLLAPECLSSEEMGQLLSPPFQRFLTLVVAHGKANLLRLNESPSAAVWMKRLSLPRA